VEQAERRAAAAPERRGADRLGHFGGRRQSHPHGVKPIIARRATEHGSGLGHVRWVVERTFARLHNFRRLRTRYERWMEPHQAFLHLG
jgi:IS5 family transposase